MDERTLRTAIQGLEKGRRIRVILESGDSIPGIYSGDPSSPVEGQESISAVDIKDFLIVVSTAPPE